MKVAVLGAGGVGGYFGARLSQGGADVHLVARGDHLKALRTGGLRVRSANGDFDGSLPATERAADVGASDVVLFCVKSTDTGEAAHRLEPLLHDDSMVVTLQNGVESRDRIAEVVGAERVIAGVAYIMATIAEPGVVSHVGTMARMIFGEDDGARSERLERLLALCRRGGIDAELSTTIRVELWRKLAMICATAGMTAAARLPIGEIRASPSALETYRRIATEVAAVAAAEGVELGEAAVPWIVEVAGALPAHSYSSLYHDLTRGKPMELETLHGSVVRRARAYGVSVPTCEAVYGILHPWALRNRSRLLD